MEEAPARTGRKYKIPGTDKTYTAAAEGEPPAIREARYRNSWQFTPAIVQGTRISAWAYTDLMVGRWVLGDLLEYGWIHGGPFPHVRPALPAAEKRIKKMLT
jgi:hypothetical protein